MKKKLAIFVLSQFLLAGWADAQQAYFIDGYHGGIYGHYPVGQTAFIAQKLRQNPNWNINIEIEPESWEVVRQRDPEGAAGLLFHLRHSAAPAHVRRRLRRRASVVAEGAAGSRTPHPADVRAGR